MIDLGDWNPRDPVLGFLHLVNINTVTGDFGFVIGVDGSFLDVNGKLWYGSSLLAVSKLQSALNGVAPSGSVTMSFFQDPDQPDLVTQVHALGLSFVKDRPIQFYLQPIADHSEFERPTVPPILKMTRTITGLGRDAEGAQGRALTLTFEAATFKRRGSRRITMNTEGHSELIGSNNPSLSYMPTTSQEDESLFG